MRHLWSSFLFCACALSARGGDELFDRVDQTLAERISDPREFASPVFDAVLTIQPPAQAWLRAESPKG